LDQGEHAFASSIPLSRKSAARERAVPGGRHLLQAEGLARRAGRLRGAARRVAARRVRWAVWRSVPASAT